MGWNQSFKERFYHMIGREEPRQVEESGLLAKPSSTPQPMATAAPRVSTPAPVAAASTPVPSATPKAAPARAKEFSVSDLVAEYTEALLIVEGNKGSGSGFLCQLGGKTVAVTNIHVIAGNPGFKLANLKSTLIPMQAAAVAAGHDVAKMEVSGASTRFELMENLDAELKIGDGVVVLGNAEGARVVKPVEGKVVGIGPELVEVDAPFVAGNSGSPIVHKATGKVVGVATYLIQRRVDKDTGVAVETRRFGYRLDSVKTWEPLNWQRFYAQAAQVEKIEQASNDFIALFENCRKNKDVSGNYQTVSVQRAVQQFVQNAAHASGRESRAIVVRRFLDDLRFATRGDVQTFDARLAYDYFRARVEEQTRLRDAIHADLTRAIENTR